MQGASDVLKWVASAESVRLPTVEAHNDGSDGRVALRWLL